MEKKKKYPIGAEHYTLYEEVGTGVSASVYRALCNTLNEVVAIKILDFERENCDLTKICREAQTMILVDHPNVLKAHCSFVSDHSLWVVMPYMAGGSCFHILKAAHPDGFKEAIIATILREALKGLEYLHGQGHIHRDIKAGNILIDSRGAVKLGDFGVSACMFDSCDRQRHRNSFVGTPCWMAPEVMEQVNGHDLKADIWSFGITALELAHGHAPFSKYPPLKVFIMTLKNAPPGLDYERDKKFSKSFRQMIGSCLVKDPSQRPTAKKLLKHSFFKQARSSDYISRTLLEGLPDLGNRLQALKKKEEDMLAQKEIPDGRKEEISQNLYKRGISNWNFDLDDLKAQASLLSDEDNAADKDQNGSSSSILDHDTHGTQLHHQAPSASQCEQLPRESAYSGNGDSDDNNLAAHSSSADSMADNNTSMNSVDNIRTPHSMHENSFSHNELNGEINSPNKNEPEGNGRPSENLKSCFSQGDKPESHLQSTSMNNGDIVPSKKGDMPCETSPKASKTVNSNEQDEKAKCHVVQQRGRFKVTSENVDIEKVISEHPAMSPPVTPVDPTMPHIRNHSLYPMLESLLQTNISQKESILSLMKKLSTGETAVDGGGDISINTSIIYEKPQLEAGGDRENVLLYEIADLQWRLISAEKEICRCYRIISAQEEVEKHKTEKTQSSGI